ncbi:hypothetical protein [uncultured Sphingomonas sp.]|uniref:hypothetical protein n=1 Tax=uncultured Sphingomonas sp. TaxID=158754 RepID=UPI0035CC24FB
MNVHAPVANFEVEMSADGEVLVPEPVRKAAGLIPGARLVIGINDDGEVVLLTRIQARRRGETPDARSERIAAALREIGDGRYSTGQSTAEVMAELRGGRQG